MSFFDNSMERQKPIAAELMRNVMQQVYLYMMMGLFTTAAAAFATLQTGLTDTIVQNPIILIAAIIGELLLVMALGMGINRMAYGTLFSMFFVYSALNGVTLSLIFLAYTTGSITSAFVSTACLFGAMSIVGMTTKVDLTKYGSFFLMALIGLIVASVINIFLRSSGLDFMISIAGVLIFTALTAYDTQRIQRMASYPGVSENPDLVRRMSLMGALHLYLDFINLFIYLLRLFGKRR